MKFGIAIVGLPAFGPAAFLLAFLFAPWAAAQTPLAERIEQCAACHGEGGNSQTEKVPSLAGQPEFFIQNQLVLMREGVRPIEAMAPFVKDLKDEDINGLASHFSRLQPKASEEKVDPKLAAKGAQLAQKLRCGSCHRQDFAGQQQMPRLAKQRIDYMLDAMKAFRDNTRSGADTLMSAAVYGVSDTDLEALAHYVASR